MLAEIAAANAAFSVIKTALKNGREIYEVGDTAKKYFDNKAAVAKKAKRGGNKNELAAFLELQKLQKEEEWLKEHMIYAGDPGMWEAWLQFQADCKRNRQAQAAAARRKKLENQRIIGIFLKAIAAIIVIIPLAGIVIKALL
jgi:hypothetical protein